MPANKRRKTLLRPIVECFSREKLTRSRTQCRNTPSWTKAHYRRQRKKHETREHPAKNNHRDSMPKIRNEHNNTHFQWIQSNSKWCMIYWWEKAKNRHSKWRMDKTETNQISWRTEQLEKDHKACINDSKVCKWSKVPLSILHYLATAVHMQAILFSSQILLTNSFSSIWRIGPRIGHGKS